ncbi:MAG: endonuclease/exonuclease/phosphatase family protein [Pseudomonadota bacterium]
MFRVFRFLLLAAMIGTSLVIIAGFFGAIHPAFDTLSNFRLHLAVLLVLMAVMWTFTCSRVPALLFALIGFFAIASASSGLPIPSGSAQASTSSQTHRLFVMNLFWANQTPEAVISKIIESKADIVMLMEFGHSWPSNISKLSASYPYQFHCAVHYGTGGVITLSRYPLKAEPRYCGTYGSLGLADTEIEGTIVTLGAVHLRWPWPASGPRLIDEQTPYLMATGENALIAGDFNSVTWSHSMARFAKAGDLDIVGNIGPTWGPSLRIMGHDLQWPRRFGLPIDNVMSKGKVDIVSATTLEPLGSDHLPILVDFQIR